jgi:hypothetical protein
MTHTTRGITPQRGATGKGAGDTTVQVTNPARAETLEGPMSTIGVTRSKEDNLPETPTELGRM